MEPMDINKMIDESEPMNETDYQSALKELGINFDPREVAKDYYGQR